VGNDRGPSCLIKCTDRAEPANVLAQKTLRAALLDELKSRASPP
jgi:hypothetical protein